MLLTTRGRKSGQVRVTPLQYEQIDGKLYVGSMRGIEADWYRNLLADSQVCVRVGRNQVRAIAHPINDKKQIEAFLREKIRRHPKMMSAMLKADGVCDINDETQLANYVDQIALVRLELVED